MAKSLAFWIDGINDASEISGESASNDGCVPEIDLHINYWLLNQNTNKELNYLDVGVKFKNLPSASIINIYFPFRVSRGQYYPGLGELVCARTDLIQTIFNSRHKSTKNTSNTSVDIEFDKDDILRVHKQIELGSEDDGVSIRDMGEGSTLAFPMCIFYLGGAEACVNPPGYFRFRIIMNREGGRNAISQNYTHNDRIILSRLESTEIVDFRINEVRDLPGIVQSKDLLCAGIKNIHFFLIREVDSEFKQAHASFHRCRLLEKELWSDYLNPDSGNMVDLPRQMLIYHWKESADKSDPRATIEKFSAFAKFGKVTVTYKTIIWFVSIAILIGAFSGILGDVIGEILGAVSKSIWEGIINFCAVHFE